MRIFILLFCMTMMKSKFVFRGENGLLSSAAEGLSELSVRAFLLF